MTNNFTVIQNINEEYKVDTQITSFSTYSVDTVEPEILFFSGKEKELSLVLSDLDIINFFFSLKKYDYNVRVNFQHEEAKLYLTHLVKDVLEFMVERSIDSRVINIKDMLTEFIQEGLNKVVYINNALAIGILVKEEVNND